MELRHLRYFLAVAEELHFGRAARRLNLSQPPLSQQIRDLEEELDAPLFARSRRKVELTPAGQALLPEARDILARAGAAADLVRRVAEGRAGRLALGFMGPAMEGLLPRAVARFRQERPDVALDLREMGSPAQVEALEQGRIGMGAIRVFGVVPAGLETFPLADEPYVLAAPAGHPLAGLARVPLRRLAGERLVFFPRRDGPALHDAILGCLARAGGPPEVVLEATAKRTILALVAAGAGLGLVPASTADTPGVRLVPLGPGLPRVDIRLAWRAGDANPLVRAFADCVRRLA